MSLILVDTSIWVDFFHDSRKSKPANILQKLIEEENDVCICPIIYQEILQGIRDDKTFLKIKFILKNILMINTPIITVADHAVDLYRSLRKKGITIRKPYDCLIASYAILENIFIFHNDFDFDQMKGNSKIKIYYWDS